MTTLQMQALLYSASSGLAERGLQIRAPRGQEVRVQVKASGICHSDLHLIDGDWPCPDRIVPGHEAAGIVESVGDDVDSVKVGDHVVLSWFPPCGACVACLRGASWLCAGNVSGEHCLPGGGTALSLDGEPVLPFIGVGALAEYVVVPQAAAIRVPEALPFEVGALIGCSVATGVGAVVNTARVAPGQGAVVLGCGGVGQATIAGLVLAGAAPIIAVDLSEGRRAMARAAGATHAFAGDAADLRDRVAAAAPSGVDFAFEAIGRTETIALAIELVSPGGAVVLEGLTSTEARLPLDVYTFAAQGKRLLGCNYGSSVPERDFPRLAGQHLSGELPLAELMGERITLPEAIDSFEDMRHARGGRAVVIFD